MDSKEDELYRMFDHVRTEVGGVTGATGSGVKAEQLWDSRRDELWRFWTKEVLRYAESVGNWSADIYYTIATVVWLQLRCLWNQRVIFLMLATAFSLCVPQSRRFVCLDSLNDKLKFYHIRTERKSATQGIKVDSFWKIEEFKWSKETLPNSPFGSWEDRKWNCSGFRALCDHFFHV